MSSYFQHIFGIKVIIQLMFWDMDICAYMKVFLCESLLEIEHLGKCFHVF